jgi:hypothetical protein
MNTFLVLGIGACRRKDHPDSERSKESMPEREFLVHIQSTRYADRQFRIFNNHFIGTVKQFVILSKAQIYARIVGSRTISKDFFAFVARDVAFPVLENTATGKKR